MPTVRTFMVVSKAFIGHRTVGFYIREFENRGGRLVGAKTITNNEIIRQLVADDSISGHVFVFEADRHLSTDRTAGFYVSDNSERAEYYIKLLFNPEELL